MRRTQDVEELPGVGRRDDAGLKYYLVTRLLALRSHIPRGQPNERTEPKDGAGKLAKDLCQRIPPFHMR
jgi:hypothetical protein